MSRQLSSHPDPMKIGRAKTGKDPIIQPVCILWRLKRRPNKTGSRFRGLGSGKHTEEVMPALVRRDSIVSQPILPK